VLDNVVETSATACPLASHSAPITRTTMGKNAAGQTPAASREGIPA
jgi:hypothetical protein